MTKENSKKYRLKKDEYIKKLEQENRELVLVNTLLANKLNQAKVLLQTPIKTNFDWTKGTVDQEVEKKESDSN